MKDAIAQTCPLSGTEAEYIPVDYGHRKYFNCPSCGMFQISNRAEKILAGAPQEWRDGYAAKVRETPEDHLFVIVVPSATGNDNNGAKPAISGSFVPKSELSLE